MSESLMPCIVGLYNHVADYDWHNQLYLTMDYPPNFYPQNIPMTSCPIYGAIHVTCISFMTLS